MPTHPPGYLRMTLSCSIMLRCVHARVCMLQYILSVCFYLWTLISQFVCVSCLSATVCECQSVGESVWVCLCPSVFVFVITFLSICVRLVVSLCVLSRFRICGLTILFFVFSVCLSLFVPNLGMVFCRTYTCTGKVKKGGGGGVVEPPPNILKL